jgi:uncharacterized short protein YbdD (DUF466 family)
MTDRVVSVMSSIARGLRAVLGVPDYSKYVEHMRDSHPGCAAMTRDEFYRDRFNARYSKPGAKCC